MHSGVGLLIMLYIACTAIPRTGYILYLVPTVSIYGLESGLLSEAVYNDAIIRVLVRTYSPYTSPVQQSHYRLHHSKQYFE